MNYLMKDVKNQKRFYIPIAILFLFALCSELYRDIIVTTNDGIRLFNSGFKWFSEGAGYPFPIYIFFGIWNFPIWLIDKFTSFNLSTYSNPLPWIWAKGICACFVLIDSKLLYRLCKNALNLDEEKSLFAMFIFLTSLTTITPALIIAQYECIPLCFILLGLISYLKEDKKKFYLYFSFAIVLKFFALFIFIPLILVKEKNVLKILGKLFIGLAFFIFFTIFGLLMAKLFHSLSSPEVYNSLIEDNSVTNSAGLASHIFEVFTEQKIGNLSLFIIFYTISCIYIWLHDFSTYDLKKLTIYICCFIFTGVFICGHLGYYYWMILTVPFIAILVVMSSKSLILLFLTTVAQACALVGTVIYIPWFFSPGNVSQLGLLPLIYVNPTPVRDLSHIVGMTHLDMFFKYGAELYSALMIYFLWLTRPKSNWMTESGTCSLPRYIWLFRFAFGFGFVFGIYILYFI